jgi:S-(hydroxymethyl)glutathione dehydrogenase/alcohol dehydrogenase
MEAHEVLARIDASGICHSDISLCDGSMPGPMPVVLGHEGAGTIVGVGASVSSLRPGDRVVLAAVAPCDACTACRRGQPFLCAEVRSQSPPSFVDGGRPLRGASGLGTLSDLLVVDERAAIRVETDLSPVELAVIGCAVLTGAGSVMNIAQTREGDDVLIVGAGGIGLAAVLAARCLGARSVVAVDPCDSARAVAVECGATLAVDPSSPDAESTMLDVTGGRGFDAAFECAGRSSAFDLAWRLTRRGGDVVAIGVPPGNVPVPLMLADIPLSGRRLSGCVYGSSVVRRDIPMYVRLAEQHRLDLAKLVGRVISVDDAPAVILAGGGGVGRTVVTTIPPDES